MAARVGYFQPRLLAAPRPFSAGQEGWGPWLSLVDGDGLDPGEPRAMVLRREVSDGHFWGTSSISLVALGRWLGRSLGHDGVRLAFSGQPGSGHFDEVALD